MVIQVLNLEILVKKNVFLYGPEFTLWNYNYYKCRLLAKLLS